MCIKNKVAGKPQEIIKNTHCTLSVPVCFRLDSAAGGNEQCPDEGPVLGDVERSATDTLRTGNCKEP